VGDILLLSTPSLGGLRTLVLVCMRLERLPSEVATAMKMLTYLMLGVNSFLQFPEVVEVAHFDS